MDPINIHLIQTGIDRVLILIHNIKVLFRKTFYICVEDPFCLLNVIVL